MPGTRPRSACPLLARTRRHAEPASDIRRRTLPMRTSAARQGSKGAPLRCCGPRPEFVTAVGPRLGNGRLSTKRTMRGDLMQPFVTARLAALPREADVVIVGAGAAGIAAARRLLADGMSVAVLEARRRVGGRAVTVSLRGHPVDLGAHWLHAGPINPLVRLGRARREPMRRAPVDGHLFVRGRTGRPDESAALDRAFALADLAMTRAARSGDDRPAGEALPPLGPWGPRVARIHGLVSGRPLAEVSLHDFPSMEYADNLFIAGGLGAFVARLSAGLPIRLGA